MGLGAAIGTGLAGLADAIGGAGTAAALGLGDAAAIGGADAALGAVGAGAGEAAATAAGAGALDAGATALGADAALGTGAALSTDALATSGLVGDVGASLAGETPAAALTGSTGALSAVADAAPSIGSALPASAGTSAAGAAAPAAAAPAASSLGAFPSADVTAALQGSETSLPAATTVANATAGANAINVVDAPAANSGDFLGNLFGGTDQSGSILHGVVNNPGAAIGGLGLGYDLLKGNQPLPGQAALNTEATQLANQGTQLESYLQTGTLPAGVQASINQATQSAIAAVKSRYAATGGDTSAMEQDIASIQEQAASQGSQIAIQLLQQGVSETQLSSELYGQLMNLAQQQNQQLGSAISSLAIAASGVPKLFTLQSASS